MEAVAENTKDAALGLLNAHHTEADGNDIVHYWIKHNAG